MIYLSRYGSESLSSWENKTVWELDAAYEAMGRLIALENGETPSEE